jgi:hypothetical protein
MEKITLTPDMVFKSDFFMIDQLYVCFQQTYYIKIEIFLRLF